MKGLFSRHFIVVGALAAVAIEAHAATPSRPLLSKTQVLQHFQKDANLLKSLGSVSTPKGGAPTNTPQVQHVICPTTGTLDVTNVTSTNGPVVTNNQTMVAHDCVKANAYEIDGSVKVLSTSNNTTHTFTETLNGTIAMMTYDSDGTVLQSGDISFNNATLTVVTNSQGIASQSTSGTITEGGQTFQFTPADIPNFGN